MKYYRFLMPSTSELPQSFESRTDFFVLADQDGTNWLYIPLSNDEEALKLIEGVPQLLTFEAVDINDYIDWGVQWSTHCPDFKDYRLEVDLKKYTSIKKHLPMLYLNAGPGFGDLSHPTTRLMLAYMAERLEGKKVLDIGSGSGILTIASIILGAASAIGLEIEDEAIEHANENAKLNGCEDNVQFMQTSEYVEQLDADTIILMNMIRSHQDSALGSLPQLKNFKGVIIVSGVLAQEYSDYMKECESKGWNLVQKEQQGDWMAFVFQFRVDVNPFKR